MNSHLTFDFIVDKEKHSIRVKREFAAELPLVWKAYTDSEILDQWWAPRPWKTKTKSMDFSEGGQWLYQMLGPEGEAFWCFAQYLRIQPLKKYTGIDGWADEAGKPNAEMPQSNFEAIFTDKGQMTLVEFNIQYVDLAQLETILQMGFKEGFALAMEGLDELLLSLKK